MKTTKIYQILIIIFRNAHQITLFIIVSAAFLSLSMAEQVVDLEFRESIYGSGEILTDCRIGDHVEKCKIDTGAPFSMSANVDLNKNSKLINEIKYYGITGSAESCNFVETNQSLSLTGKDFKSRVLLICPSRSEKGLLGLNHLTEFPVHINIKNRKLIFNPKVIPGNLHNYLIDSNDHIFIEIEIFKSKSRHKILAMLDTGAALTVANKDLIKSHPEFVTLISSDGHAISDTNNAEIETQIGFLNGLQISNKKIIIPYVMFTDFKVLKEQTGLDVDMIIGVNVLRELSEIYFDASKKKWAVD